MASAFQSPSRTWSGTQSARHTGLRSVSQSSADPSLKPFKKTLTCQDYANASKLHSEHDVTNSLFPGPNYINLAAYLGEPFHTRAKTVAPGSGLHSPTSPEFAAFYRLSRPWSDRFRYLSTPEDLVAIEREICSAPHASAIDDARSEPGSTSDEVTEGRLLFLRGHASPQWLNQIGATYGVDPEFFNRHRDYAAMKGRQEYFASPSLASTNLNMLRMRYTTVGRRTSKRRNEKLSQKYLDSLRLETRSALSEYIDERLTTRSAELSEGASIVREFSLHDPEYFSIEQDISIYLTKAENGWVAIIWLDIGRDLNESPRGPWNSEPFSASSWNITYLPTIQHKSRVALKPHRAPSSRSTSAHADDSQHRIPQSASLLHLGYGKDLERDPMAREAMTGDPFYALHDLLRFVGFSTVQLLNTIKTTVHRELDHSVLIQEKSHALSNIVYNKQIIERHTEYLNSILTFLRSRSSYDLPAQTAIASTASQQLLRDFEELLDRARTLIVECDDGLRIMMQNAVTVEARSQLNQTEVMAKLTKLAFIFVPLSFTTSLCGMNIRELSSDSIIGLATWFYISMPLLAVSVFFMLVDLQVWMQRGLTWCRNVRKTRRSKRGRSMQMFDDIEMARNGNIE